MLVYYFDSNFCDKMFFHFQKTFFWHLIFSKSEKYRSSHNFFTSPITKFYFYYKFWFNPNRISVSVWHIIDWTFFNSYSLKFNIYLSKLLKIKSTSSVTNKS